MPFIVFQSLASTIGPQLDAAIDSNIDKTIRERESVRRFK